MQQIINGKLYDTEKSEYICGNSYLLGIYKTSKGTWLKKWCYSCMHNDKLEVIHKKKLNLLSQKSM